MSEHGPKSQEDLSRMFREQGDIGADSSVFLRPLRQLLEQGKPVGQVHCLTTGSNPQRRLPFGMLTETKKGRLVFWSVLPRDTHVLCPGSSLSVIDHITLELPTGKSHVTGYDHSGRRVHSGLWELQHMAESRLALWFTLLVPMSVLLDQDNAVQRVVRAPTPDAKRRIDEFVRYTRSMRPHHMALPSPQEETNCVWLTVFLSPPASGCADVGTWLTPVLKTLGDQVEGLAADCRVRALAYPVRIGTRTVCVVVACPPGELRNGVVLGLPRQPVPSA